MALDPNKLSRDELVQLLNSTSLGESLTRGRLSGQMNRSGRRWHDGRHIRLLDYLRWLVREVERPARSRVSCSPVRLFRSSGFPMAFLFEYLQVYQKAVDLANRVVA